VQQRVETSSSTQHAETASVVSSALVLTTVTAPQPVACHMHDTEIRLLRQLLKRWWQHAATARHDDITRTQPPRSGLGAHP
jgi:hypothetical protein